MYSYLDYHQSGEEREGNLTKETSALGQIINLEVDVRSPMKSKLNRNIWEAE